MITVTNVALGVALVALVVALVKLRSGKKAAGTGGAAGSVDVGGVTVATQVR